MNTSGEAADQVIKLTMEGVEITAKLVGGAAKHIALMLLAAFKNPRSKVAGKMSMARMIREHQYVKIVSFQEQAFVKFRKEARKYGIVYHTIKHSGGTYDVVVPEENIERVNYIIDKFHLGAEVMDAAFEKIDENEIKPKGQEAQTKSRKREGRVPERNAKANEPENPAAAKAETRAALPEPTPVQKEPTLELIVPSRTIANPIVSRQKADGKTDGIKYANGAEYNGEVQNGIPNGRGTVLFANGDKYEGEVSNGEINGYGRMISRDGYIYEGEFKNGKFDGHGQITCPNGETFAVESQNGRVYDCKTDISAVPEQKKTRKNLLPPTRDESKKPSVHEKLEKNKRTIARRKQERNRSSGDISKTSRASSSKRAKVKKSKAKHITK